MKKIVSVIIPLCIIVIVLGISSIAVSAASSGTCGDNLTWVIDDEGTLTISGTGVIEESNCPAWWDEECEKLLISDGVTEIGDFVFSECTFKNVDLPSGLITIGEGAFSECYSLESITIPDTVEYIGGFAFNSNNLEKVVIPNRVTYIGDYAFYNCTNLTEVTILWDGEMACTVEIGEYAFADCEKLTSMILPISVKSIGFGAFSDCSSLTSIIIPETITYISGKLFEGCTSLKSIELHMGVSIIRPDAFNGCNSLESVTMHYMCDGIFYGAFYNCTALTDVYFYGTEDSWNGMEIGLDNDCLLNANIHFMEKDPATIVVIGGEEHECYSIEEAGKIANEAGKACIITLFDDVDDATFECKYRHIIDLNGANIATLNITGDSSIENGTVTNLNVEGIVLTENVSVITTNAVTYATDGVKGIYTNYEKGADMVEGAQVRIGGGVDANGIIDSESGLRFICKNNMLDTLAGVIVAEHFDGNSYDEGYEVGVEVIAESSDVAVYIPASKWQDNTNSIFTVALTGLKSNNFNRKFTARAYVEYNGIKILDSESVTRSMYAVAAGLLTQSGEDNTEKLINVLNAYVNQTGIRLIFSDNTLTVNSADSGRNGAYSGEAFFSVGKTTVEGNVYTVVLTPVGENTEIDTGNFAKYIRINNNNSDIATAVTLVKNSDNTYTLVFDLGEVK